MPQSRRPIAARDWVVSRNIAILLVRCRVPPNAISVIGMIAGIGAGMMLAATRVDSAFASPLLLCSSVLIIIRLAANMFDGMVALEGGTSSSLGVLFNEVPDRVSDTAILMGLGYARESWPVAGVIAAITAMFTAYIRAIGAQCGAHQDFGGPMAKQHRMAIVISAIVIAAIWQPSWLFPGSLIAICIGSLVTAGLRLRRIAAILRRTP